MLFNPLPRRSRSNCREWFARNALRRDARNERTTDGVKKSVKRIRDAPNYIIDFASNTRANADRFCIFISVKAWRPRATLVLFSRPFSISPALFFFLLWRNNSLIDEGIGQELLKGLFSSKFFCLYFVFDWLVFDQQSCIWCNIQKIIFIIK